MTQVFESLVGVLGVNFSPVGVLNFRSFPALKMCASYKKKSKARIIPPPHTAHGWREPPSACTDF
jgi:hypothetical protein